MELEKLIKLLREQECLYSYEKTYHDTLCHLFTVDI